MDLAYIETIPFYENICAKVHSDSKAGTVKVGPHTILPNPQHGNFIIRTENGAVEFDFKNPQDKANLDAQFCRGSAHICNVKSVGKDGFLFDLYVFAGAPEDFGEVTVLAEENNLKNLQNKKNQSKIDELQKQLAKDCTIQLDGSSYFIMQGNYGKSDEEESADEEDGEEEKKDKVEPAGAFSILCERFKKCYGIKVQQKNLTSTGADKYFALTGVSYRKNIQTAGNFHLVKAKLVFSDQKKAASEYNRKKLEEITEKNGSYLKSWQEYTGARGDRVLRQARKFDSPHYNNCVPTSSDSVKLYFNEKISDRVSESDADEIILCKNGDPIPLFLQDKKCSFLEYCEKKKEADAERKKNKVSKKDEVCCTILNCRDNWMEIRLPDGKNMPSADEVEQKGFVAMSMKGEESQIERQQFAWESIRQGKSGISSLGNILEGSFDFMPSGSTPPKIRITNRVREKIFKNRPTDRQLEAIDLALRTPDIALIQGPPGTGKTTVITAVLEILNETQDKRGVSAGRVLATSYQHDAVENMIERIKVNALPTWKYGTRHGSAGNYNEHIDLWCREIEERVYSLNPDVCVSHEEETFHARVAEYVYSPLPENRESLLEYISTLPVTDEIASKARNLLLKKGAGYDSYNAPDLLRKIRALRTTEKAFSDDGSKRAENLYFALEERKWFSEHKEAEKLLMDLVMGTVPSENQLSELSKLKLELLEEFSPRPAYVCAEAEEDVVSLCKMTANFLESRHGKKDKKDLIIADWIANLQGGREAFSRAIKDCDFVYAATSQQSVGRDILAQKKAVEAGMETNARLYDTVIIDEAARAAPPDLLIPMCMAVKRIILVGDHRQLPQLVDDDLCNDVYKKVRAEIERDENHSETDGMEDSYEDSFKLSLFELLFKKLKDLEKKDGVKRTITLDKQFRTHPVLGNLCSNLFYKEEGGYDSPRGASDFSHNLPGIENKAAVWIDVSKECGKEEKSGTSRIRECEAECIVERFLSFVRSQKDVPKDRKFSYGIIAFYSAQRDLIQKKISSHNGELKDVSYKVGTVDAFQGMEFDVVFLSTVRSNGSIDFLTPNRLCVSMSRQKKVLVAVGCKDFFTSKEARNQKIPALSEFYDLCAGKNDDGYGAVLTWKK